MLPLLNVSGICGGYGRQSIIREISLEINQGDFIGLIGPNGSGKTTFLRLISRVLCAQKGKVLLEGRDISEISLKDFCRKIAFVPQDTPINFPFKVREIVMMGRIPHLGRMQLEGARDRQVADEAMVMTQTIRLEAKKIDELSSGERQRVIIAKALTQEPVLLLLDEPTSHLDIGHQIQILDLLRRLNRRKLLTLVMVLHDLNLAAEYCNRIVLLEEGRVFKEGAPQEVLTYQNIEAVYKTVVVVNNNPISRKPHVILVPGEK